MVITRVHLYGLSARLGAAEQRTEPYKRYGERAAQAATTYCAKNVSAANMTERCNEE
ncbi:MAG: hypothetical protein U0524_04025 [Candidatus Saccharimonadales bacterium]